ncbi:MAG: universal stress protein [Pseudomonadales bacterium]
MKSINSIVIGHDRLDGIDRALEKAAVIEHYSGASIVAAEVIYDSIGDEPPEVLPRDQQARLIEAFKAAERAGLANAAEPYRERVANLELKVVWNRRADEGILHLVDEHHADLLIKPISEHHRIADYLHAPLDWTLTRTSPCAVLVSKGSSWQNPRAVLAAVDVADETHQALCREILSTAATLAAVLGTRLHVVCAYPSLGQSVNELQVAMDFEGIKADMRANRDDAVRRLLAELAIDDAEIHLLEGKPADVIPALASELGVTLTVLGTAARKGLKKLLIGNTAEDIISRIDGDIVTVRE